jgi:hypothetical protein
MTPKEVQDALQELFPEMRLSQTLATEGFWGRACARLLDKNNKLKEKLAAAVAAIELSAMDELFFGRDHKTGEIAPYIIVNDIFAYATSDCQKIEWKDIPQLLAKVKAEGWPAAVKWVVEQRGIKPLGMVESEMDLISNLQEKLALSEAAGAEMRAIIEEFTQGLNPFSRHEYAGEVAYEGKFKGSMVEAAQRSLASDHGKEFLDMMRGKQAKMEKLEEEIVILRQVLEKCYNELLGTDRMVKSALHKFGIQEAIKMAAEVLYTNDHTIKDQHGDNGQEL